MLKPDGFNILNCCRPAAWQTVFHYHWHVIPRYEDDPLKLPWIPRGGPEDEIAAIADKADEGKMADQTAPYAWSATATSPTWCWTTRR